MMKRFSLWGMVVALGALFMAFPRVARADWATGITTATSTLSADLLAVGAIILGLVALIYGFRVVKGMIGR